MKPALRPCAISATLLAGLVLCHAIAAAELLLNSERIQQRFGSYGVEIVRADAKRRVSSLYSTTDSSENICRTYAVVEFNQPIDRRLLAEHERIVSGESIGTVFAEAGWIVLKETLFIGESDASGYDDNLGRLMHIDGEQTLATHRYRFIVSRNNELIEYATITEVHHPDYLDTAGLHAIYD
ncbi:MAG: hypothetical protein RLN69_00875 [Woeseiaceae bacterium]